MKFLESLMGMNDEVWERHTNPKSGWSRISILPLLALAIWSRVWIGYWCLIPIALTLIWTWWNPRAFSKPVSTSNWMSKGVFGERVWLNRKQIAIPVHHKTAGWLISLVPIIGLVPFVWGLYYLDVLSVIMGSAFMIFGKLWFLDRMVWLFEDMALNHTKYKNWIK